jgi:probable F420-dependent oxidoreductase
MGRGVGPDALARVAAHAETLDYDTLWVADRLLSPVSSRDPYPVTPDGSLPEFFKHVLEPLETLTFVAAQTRRIRLGTAVLVLPFYNPVVLARRLTTLDVLSNGRLRVGFGLGWSRDEFEAAGTTRRERGARADEFLRLLKAIWTTDPVEFQGKYYSLPKSWIGPKPVQKPHPPIYLAAFVPAALERAARLADGWLPAGLPVPQLGGAIAFLRDRVGKAGRDPTAFEVIVQAPVQLGEAASGQERRIFSGSESQVRADFEAVRDLGVEEVYVAFAPEERGLDAYLAGMERMRGLVS